MGVVSLKRLYCREEGACKYSNSAYQYVKNAAMQNSLCNLMQQ
jgi:hypothetical protein